MFFLMKWHFLKYKYQQITLYSIKIIVNLKIFKVGIPVNLNLWVYRRNSPILLGHSLSPMVLFRILIGWRISIAFLVIMLNVYVLKITGNEALENTYLYKHLFEKINIVFLFRHLVRGALWLDIAPSQLHQNGWVVVRCYELLFAHWKVPCITMIFFSVYRLKLWSYVN